MVAEVAAGPVHDRATADITRQSSSRPANGSVAGAAGRTGGGRRAAGRGGQAMAVAVAVVMAVAMAVAVQEGAALHSACSAPCADHLEPGGAR